MNSCLVHFLCCFILQSIKLKKPLVLRIHSFLGCWGALTFGHLGLSSQAFSASSRAAWCWPNLRKAAERLLYRMQFCESTCSASLYKWTAAWKSPRWHASLLCCTFSMNSALLRPYLAPSSPTHRIGLPAVREPKIENWRKGQGAELWSVWLKNPPQHLTKRNSIKQRPRWVFFQGRYFKLS